MDSTSKLGALTSSFLSSCNGRKSFSTKKKSCLGSMGEKVEKKKEELEGCRRSITEDRVSKWIKKLKHWRKHLFLGILIQIASKRLQAFVQYVAKTMQIPARWLARICRERQMPSADVSEAHCHWATTKHAVCQRGALLSCCWLLAMTTEKYWYSSGSGIDPHSSLQDS